MAHAKGENLQKTSNENESAAGREALVTASAPHGASAGRGRRRIRRILVRSMVALIAVVVVAALGLYAVVNHLESNIRRIPVTLAAAPQDSKRLTVLITSTETGPTGLSGPASTGTGMIMLLHLDADGVTGGVVSIPGSTVVPVPGHGTTAIQNATIDGGPSLLVQTVHQLTGVPINHFARVDFNQVVKLTDTVGGGDVPIPTTFPTYDHTSTSAGNNDSLAAFAKQYPSAVTPTTVH